MSGDETNLTFGRCADCGGTIKLQTGPGRTREYLRGVWLAVPDDFGTPVCSDCKEEYMAPEVSERLDALLRESLTVRINQCVKIIQTRDGVTQQQIEDALGVTRSYLSHLRAGRKEPSGPLVKLLELCALSADNFHHLCERQPFAILSVGLFVVSGGKRFRAGSGFSPLRQYQRTYEVPVEASGERLSA